MQRALLCGYYGKGNGGDEALLATLLQMLGDRYQPLVLSADPAATEKLHQVECRDRGSVLSVIQSLRRSDLFIWGGGSLIQDATSLRNPIYYGGLMALAQKLGLATIAWAQGIGPLEHAMSRWIARQVLQRCDRISVRDDHSAQLLQTWQIPSQIAPDPVWALAAQPQPQIWDLPAPRIAVCLRAHSQLTPDRLNNLTQALVWLQQATGAYMLLIPFQPSQDQAIAEDLHRAMPDHSQVMHQPQPQQLKGIFRGVEMVIAMRLHALIMALAEGCLAWGISYDPKVSYLMQELNMPYWPLNQLPLNPKIACQDWLEHYVNGDRLSDDQLLSLRDRAYIHQQLLT
ncbi:MAG: polysaccharide pyruvyl transferase CsaB [Pseudanabaenaceae cyanobacterium bins.68]|nr:polysaccharide pyruvyl transferase CsaB [Pseudanabaenaceae cyanobacterium bins.68]